MIAKEGYTLVAIACVLALVLVLIGVRVPVIARVILFVLAGFVVAFTLYFFRDPQRTPPEGAGTLLLAPADGKVVVVEEVDEPLYLKGPARQISIFLSPLNVHVNRAPADGVIEYDQYVSGDYLVAWHPKASEKNERSQLGLRHPSGTPVLFKQIAGAVARRVVYHVTIGDTVKAGERFGIVKFGSRMDILMPLDVPIEVAVGDRVRAGETILGRLPNPAAVGARDAAEAVSPDVTP